jgi:hypothetical protein
MDVMLDTNMCDVYLVDIRHEQGLNSRGAGLRTFETVLDLNVFLMSFLWCCLDAVSSLIML